MNSEQEQLIHQLSTHSMGAPFIFEPPIYDTGKGQREPADLVWACNNVVILLYMKGKKEDTTSSSEIILNRRKKLIEANFRQAKGWIKEWRDGRELIGRNDYQEFKIKYSQKKHCIVLGIIDYGDQEGCYHLDYAEDLGVNMCATFSQKALEYIISMGCTFIDIVQLILGLKNSSQKGSEISVINFVESYYIQAIQKADPMQTCFRLDGNEIYWLIETYQKGFRSMANGIGKDNTSSQLSEILNDIDLEDFLYFNVYVTDLLEKIGPNVGFAAIRILKLKRYKIILGISSYGNFPLIGQKMADALTQNNSEDGIISILFEIEMGGPIVAFFPRESSSEVERLLSANA